MATFTAHRLTTAGGPHALADIVPEVFAPMLATRWAKAQVGSVFDVRLASRSQRAWRAVGEDVTRRLLARSRSFGMVLDGTLALQMATDWLDALGADDQSAVQIRVASKRYRAPGRDANLHGAIVNVSWSSVHRTDGNLSWSTIWQRIDSRWFNQACDLLLIFYDVDALPLIGAPEALDVTALEGTLHAASAWLVPLDNNLGFTVGVRQDLEATIVSEPA